MSANENKVFTSAYRSCPIHGNDLEIRTVDFSDSSSAIRWYCELCEGEWAETCFLYEFEKALKSRLVESNLPVQCPKCHSSDVMRSCHITCCNGHQCQKCEHDFDVLFNEVKSSACSDEEVLELRKRVWLEDRGFSYQPDSVEFKHVAEVKVFAEHEDYEECDKEDGEEVPLTLVVNHQTLDERERFSWFCSECKSIYSDEACSGSSRNQHFTSSKKGSDMRCVKCHHPWFNSKQNGEVCCVTCNAEFRVKYGV